MNDVTHVCLEPMYDCKHSTTGFVHILQLGQYEKATIKRKYEYSRRRLLSWTCLGHGQRVARRP